MFSIAWMLMFLLETTITSIDTLVSSVRPVSIRPVDSYIINPDGFWYKGQTKVSGPAPYSHDDYLSAMAQCDITRSEIEFWEAQRHRYWRELYFDRKSFMGSQFHRRLWRSVRKYDSSPEYHCWIAHEIKTALRGEPEDMPDTIWCVLDMVDKPDFNPDVDHISVIWNQRHRTRHCRNSLPPVRVTPKIPNYRLYYRLTD